MSRYAFNNGNLGDYDFFMQYIQIYLEKLNVSIPRAQEIVKNGGADIKNESELAFYKTYIHEMHHFLDCTTSLWGLNFTARAYNYYREINHNALEVFCIDFGEIAKHNRLSISMIERKLQFESIRISPHYSPDYGAFIRINYIDYESIVHSTPISTISVLESHAYAQEQLFAIRYHRSKNDYFSIIMLENEINDLLKDALRTEYTSLISLTKRVMPNLDLEYVMIAITVITRAALNVPTMYSYIGERVINHVFKYVPDAWKYALRTDLSRGANVGSRFYILLMWLASYNDIKPFAQNEDFAEKINDIIMDVHSSLADAKHYEFSRSNELRFYLDKLTSLNANLTVEAASQDVYNSDISFHALNYKLPDVILSSGEIINAARSLNIDIVKHADEIMSVASSLEFKSLNYPRMHMSPEQSQSFYEKTMSVKVDYGD